MTTKAPRKTPKPKQPKFSVEQVEVSSLKPHPHNYRTHTEQQLVHIVESIREHGIYRNIVVARDNTILAGHGVAQAVEQMGMKTISVHRVDLDPNESQALKILTGDNEISNLAAVDDRALTEMLKEIKEIDVNGLLGTGFDDQVLANLLMVTRPQSEIDDFDAAAEWVGMPEHEGATECLKLVISFKTQQDREAFVKHSKIKIDKRESRTWSTRWPFTARKDLAALRFRQ